MLTRSPDCAAVRKALRYLPSRYDADPEDRMQTVLARSWYGRTLLHVIAMILDGQVRWHCAGMLRELRV